MAKTMISDVIVPEVFAAYVAKMTKELSNIVRSGVANSDPKFDEFVRAGGKLINMPFWNPLNGADEVLSDSTPLTPDKITASQDVAALLIRGKAWSANQLAGALAGSSPMQAIASQVAQWWARQEQRTLLSILSGVFGGTLATTHVNNISASGAPNISANAVLDTKQLLGDAAGSLTAMVMHSATFTSLQKQNLITYIPNARGEIDFPYYLGYRLIVDDMAPVDSGVYGTFLFAAGAIGRGDGVPTDLQPVETYSEPLQHDNGLVNRRAYLLHPMGVKFNNATVSGATPTNADLALPANWTRVVEPKAVGMAMLMHRIA